MTQSPYCFISSSGAQYFEYLLIFELMSSLLRYLVSLLLRERLGSSTVDLGRWSSWQFDMGSDWKIEQMLGHAVKSINS